MLCFALHLKMSLGSWLRTPTMEKMAIKNNYRGKRTHCNKYYNFVNMVEGLKHL